MGERLETFVAQILELVYKLVTTWERLTEWYKDITLEYRNNFNDHYEDSRGFRIGTKLTGILVIIFLPAIYGYVFLGIINLISGIQDSLGGFFEMLLGYWVIGIVAALVTIVGGILLYYLFALVAMLMMLIVMNLFRLVIWMFK